MILADILGFIPLNRKVQQLRHSDTLLNISTINLTKLLKCFSQIMEVNIKEIHQLCNNLGISGRFSCPYTSTHNDRVERKHRHVVETRLTLLAQARMTLNFG